MMFPDDDRFWKAYTPVETLRSYAVELERQAKSAQDAINRAYEDIGRYTERRDKTRTSIAHLEAAIQQLEETSS